jgi:thiosulfate reductase cytochrome b subunit
MKTMPIELEALKQSAPRRLHPLPVRIMHWINAVAIFIMIGSGWKIYNDDIIFSFLRFPDAVVIGKWAQYGLQWHFFGMWIFVLNGIAYLCYGIASGRFWHKLFPISPREVFVTVGEALRFRLRHDDLTHYNAVQKVLYLGVMAVGVLIVISGLALWKPGQWSGPNLRAFLTRIGADLTAKYVYFICNDDFTESIDMASALHPQTILATKYAGEIIGDPFGYPLRLRTSTKLGYKNAKWIKAIEVTNEFRETYWSERGENWYAGI